LETGIVLSISVAEVSLFGNERDARNVTDGPTADDTLRFLRGYS